MAEDEYDHVVFEALIVFGSMKKFEKDIYFYRMDVQKIFRQKISLYLFL